MRIKNSTLYKMLGAAAIGALLIFSLYGIFNRPETNPLSQSNTVTLPASGGDIKVNDFTRNPVQTATGAMEIAKTEQFNIVYFSEDQSFLITLTAKPLQEARDGAERSFLQKLGIREAEACRLKVSLTIPFDVDENLSGRNYGLSFCPFGVPF